jgi:DMSO/TMAO reductase YedYZ molybdopterin-dependent catalytic subunit
VTWLFDNPAPIHTEQWQLIVEGAVDRPAAWRYADLEPLAVAETTATLDCTGGWYSTQLWRGARIEDVLNRAGARRGARSVTIESVTGYARKFSIEEARSLILATHVADRPLDHAHGFPIRLAAVNHRGFDWVKWVVRITVSEHSEIWQPPVPLQ